ncbi:MAG: hypothetical protein ACJZZ7_03825 [Cytophagales bacterium]
MKKIVSFLFISFISCNEASEDADTELTIKEIVEVYLLNNSK